MTEELNEVPGTTPDFTTDAASKLAELFPEVVSDGKINLETLRTILDIDVEDARERFGLTWPGKRDAIRAAQTPTTATLMPDKENSVDWDSTHNVFIEGDNLEVLKILQKHYYGQIKTIYIDPPYNTGKDFVYADDYADSIGNYLELTGQTDEGGKLSTNSESAGRFHSNWLNMMYPRLKLAKNLLAQDGVIFVSIDDNEAMNLKSLLDQIFGESNFISQFIWHSSTGGGIRSKFVNLSHQYVLCYARNSAVAEMFWAPLTPDAIRQYKQHDAKGKYRDKDFAWKNSSTNPNQRYEIVAPDGEVLLPKPGYIYRFVQPRFEEELRAGNVTFKRTSAGPLVTPSGEQANWNIYIKKYLKDGKGAPASVIHRGLVGINNEGTVEVQSLFGSRVFENPKNVRLLTYLLGIVAGDGDTVLDFFAGSGSTAHAVMQLNAEDGGKRRCISVQLPERTEERSEGRKAGYETISQITRDRIRLAGNKILEEEAAKLDGRADSLDVGFRAYKLVDTNFTKWKADSGLSEDELVSLFSELSDSANDDARPEALLTEVLLKLGFSLTETIETVSVDSLSVYSVADGAVMAYLDEHTTPTLDQLRALVAQEPERLVILEDAFKGNDELKTNLVQECRTHNVDLWTA